MNIIDVYIRHENETVGEYVGEFTPDQIRNLKNVVGDHAIYDDDTGEICHLVGTQFVRNAGLFFEIIIGEGH